MYQFSKMNKEGWLWFNGHLPVLAIEDSCGFVASKDGKYVAGCVLDTWVHNSVQAHLLIIDPFVLRHGFLELILSFVFIEKGKKVMYGLVPGDNIKAISLNKKMGCTEKCRLVGAFKDGVDYVIMELKKENCKYLLKEVA